MEQLSYGVAGHGVDEIRSHFRERFEHETAGSESRVRHHHLLRVDDQVTNQYEVEVERARSPDERSLPSTLVLNRLKLVQQLLRWDSRPADHSPVQKARLVADPFRLGDDER